MMNSAMTVEDGDFPPNPFRSAPPPQQQQQIPQQQQHEQQNLFVNTAPQGYTHSNQSPLGSDPLHGGNDFGFAQPAGIIPSGPTNTNAYNLQAAAAASMPTGQMDTGADSSHGRGVAVSTGALAAPQSRWEACLSCFSLETYKAYFDIDTVDVYNRLKASVVLFYVPDKFRTEIIGTERTETLKGPDLYGPLWITMTLVFFVALSSNLSAYLRASSAKDFEYDINHLAHAMWILFTFSFGVPALFWFMTQCLGMQALLMVDWICLYGYSMVPYIPATFLCLVPWQIWIWLMLLLATAVSAILVARNVASAVLGADTQGNKAGPILIAVLAFHVIFFLALKFTFYW